MLVYQEVYKEISKEKRQLFCYVAGANLSACSPI